MSSIKDLFVYPTPNPMPKKMFYDRYVMLTDAEKFVLNDCMMSKHRIKVTMTKLSTKTTLVDKNNNHIKNLRVWDVEQMVFLGLLITDELETDNLVYLTTVPLIEENCDGN